MHVCVPLPHACVPPPRPLNHHHHHHHPPVAFTKWTRADEMEGVESQFATNYLGHYALCKGLLPELTRAGTPVTEKGEGSPARIILVSSVLHKVRKGEEVESGGYDTS